MIWCLHGNLGVPTDWKVLSEYSVFDEYLIRKVDLWRYLSCKSIGLEEFGEVFASEVQAQDSEPYIIGYSMGGRLALHALQASPSLWKGAMLISTHPGFKTEKEREERLVKDAEWGALALGSEWGDFLAKWNAQGVLGRLPESMPDRYLLQPRAHEVARAFCAWSLGGQKDFRNALVSSIKCPVAIVTGELDQKFTQLSTEMKFRNSQRVVVPGVGHRTLWEGEEKSKDVISKAMSFMMGELS